MTTNHLQNLRELTEPTVRQLEQQFGWRVIANPAVLEECAVKAAETLGQVQGVAHPNTLKIAGHYAFWLRKLKPFSLYVRDEVRRLLDALGCRGAALDLPPSHQAAGGQKDLLVNELIAVFVALSVVRAYRTDGAAMRINQAMINDWLMSLRHHSHSPSSLALLLEALTQVKPK